MVGNLEIEDLAGTAAQVFEVTDLTIPAGTNWSFVNGTPHVLGTISIPSYKLHGMSLYIEQAVTPTDAGGLDDLSLGVYSTTTSEGVTSTGTSNTNRWAERSHWANVLDSDFITVSPTVAPPAEVSYEIRLYTSNAGVPPADITVVRARASFQVI
jgi:hypothetical protein